MASWREVDLNESLLETDAEMQSFGTLKPCQAKSFQVKF
ncbi:hypothetical protein JCM19231_1880 [Vibrio ishigakensis]|uniref:Uncharacterized protein n=1 Tax=Vibrio ishigakensis TaxID=1481914 RepID=A0A0B8NWF5_9VIBR|nr:hypothetical protein JCM19231_1880 [Vibrio ishigakensis]